MALQEYFRRRWTDEGRRSNFSADVSPVGWSYAGERIYIGPGAIMGPAGPPSLHRHRGDGGVFYVMGGGIANMLTNALPNTKVTAEATAAAVDNCKLIGARKADLTFSPGDVLYDAYVRQESFKSKIPLRTLLIVYANFSHFVASEGSGIKSLPELRGKRVPLGAPGSGTEVKAARISEALEIDSAKDIKRDRLSVAESAGAMKEFPSSPSLSRIGGVQNLE